MFIKSADGKEKILCASGSPSNKDLMDAYELAQEKGYTTWTISYFPGAISVITLDPDPFYGTDSIETILSMLSARHRCNKERIKELQEDNRKISTWLFDNNGTI